MKDDDEDDDGGGDDDDGDDGDDDDCDYRHRTQKTLRFRVYEIDRKKGEMRYMGASLDGLAMFVGSNRSLAIPAAEDLNLSPDSIYFTEDGGNYGKNNDIGIFNYVDSKVSSIDYPSESQISTTSSELAPVMWLAPEIF
ncbi:hypothetical protein AAHA92_04168 [Salvia divinorum]